MLSSREAIAVVILVVYIPSFLASIFVNIRQGVVHQLCFLYLVIFCGLRIAGAIMEILSQKHPDSISDATWAAILSSIGLSPLLLASTGLLIRVNNLVPSQSPKVLILHALHIPCILALIIAIIGGTELDSSSAHKRKHASDYLKASSILFLFVLAGFVGIAGLTMRIWSRIPAREKQIFVAVLLAIPFLAVRMIYVLLLDFDNKSKFQLLDPNPYTQLGMSVIMEIIVTVAFIYVGIMSPGRRERRQAEERQAVDLGPGRKWEVPPGTA